ncbi:MAG: hypothetical protein U0414_01510 [Polyangiaceae bacterium]
MKSSARGPNVPVRANGGATIAILAALVAFAAPIAGCTTDSTGTGGGGSGSSTTAGSTSSSSSGGCTAADCTAPGEACVSGVCKLDCRHPGATPCAAPSVCDASDQSAGLCVAPDAACVTTSAPETCGDRTCGPGTACNGNGKCYPRVPCNAMECDADGCWGTECRCERAIGCSPAPLGAPGDVGTLHDDAFRAGLVDLDFDPDCGAWGATLISGPDHLRTISPGGVVSTFDGVTNLNMGEVSVLKQVVVPQSAPAGPGQGPALPHVPPAPPVGLDVALTYICCAACGCQLQSTPQGVARFDPDMQTLPLVIPSQTFTTGNGPFGAPVIDTGPAGLSYGLDRVLHVGNVNTNGDYYRLDLATAAAMLVTTFPARVHASTPFDAVHMLVALEGGEIRLLAPSDGMSTLFATTAAPVVGMVRDFFDGTVYVALRDGSIFAYDESGTGALYQTTPGPARITIAPDGYLYGLVLTPPFADTTPTVTRWELPKTR